MMYVYKFEVEYGRDGCLYGMFIADSDEVDAAIGKQLYFGEALGKHSCVNFVLEKGDVEIVPLATETVKDLFRVFADKNKCTECVTIVGYNPLHYICEDE